MEIKHIKQLADAIGKNVRDQELAKLAQFSQLEIQNEIDYLSNNRDQIRDIGDLLFPENIPISSNFYHKLLDFQYYLGFNKPNEKLIAFLLIECYRRLSNSDASKLLASLVDDGAFDFWNIIHVMPIFLAEVELLPDFASNWFTLVGQKIGADLAGGDFFTGVENYAFNFPQSGLRVLENYFKKGFNTPLTLHLSAIMLGSLRSSEKLMNKEKEAINNLEEQLVNHPKTIFRIVYYRSFITSFSKGITSLEKFASILDKMLIVTSEEMKEAYNVLYRCSFGKKDDAAFSSFVIKWFKKHVSNNISSEAKFYLVNTIQNLSQNREQKSSLLDFSETNRLLILIQPIPNDDAGTWISLEHYMVERLHKDLESFSEFLHQLADSNSIGLAEQIKAGRFRYLISELSKIDLSVLMTNFLLSTNPNARSLAKLLFQHTPQKTLSKDLLNKANEKQLKILILDFIRQPLLGDATSAYLLALEPAFVNRSPDLIEEFEQEMTMQAINYPGACLEKWKNIDNPSELLKRVLQKADVYFDGLKKTSNSPANSFLFPEVVYAAEKGTREFSRSISESVKDKSLLRKLVKSVQIIYGDKWSRMIQDQIDDSTPFRQISHSLESPRLEEIDAEGMFIRRMMAGVNLKNLEMANAAES